MCRLNWTESSGQVFDSSAHPGARASRPQLMRTGTSALPDETRNDSWWIAGYCELNSFYCLSFCRSERMMYICKKIECQAIWQIMSQRMNTNMKTNTKTDQILRPSDSLQTIEKKHGSESNLSLWFSFSSYMQNILSEKWGVYAVVWKVGTIPLIPMKKHPLM